MRGKRIVRSINRRLVVVLVLLWAMSLWSATTLAQSSQTKTAAAGESADPALYALKVAHDHRIGKGVGELRITETGIAYRGASAEEERHSQVWRDTDIKRLEITKTELRITAYGAARIPLIPRKVPFSRGGKSVRTGSERKHVFRLTEGEFTPDLVRLFLARFKRPVTTSVFPEGDAESGQLFFEIPVFHRRRSGGDHGVLQVYEDRVIFAAEAADRSRYWRYPDVKDIGRIDRYQFEVATYEDKYIFDLKRPMTDVEYDLFWRGVYENEQSPRLRPAPGRVKVP